MNKVITCIMVGCLTFVVVSVNETQGASARCEVVKKEGNVLIMDCGERAEGFSEQSRVKIKTDRDDIPKKKK